MKLNKKLQALADGLQGKTYKIVLLEGRKSLSDPWEAVPLRGNQLIPRSFFRFSKEEGKNHAIWKFEEPRTPGEHAVSYALFEEITHSADFRQVVLTATYGRLTYQQV